MIVDLTKDEISEFIIFCQHRATNARDYNEVEKYVKLVDRLTNPQLLENEVNNDNGVGTVVEVNKFTDTPLTYPYNTPCKREYHIDRLYSREGHLICRGRPLKLTIPQILGLKEVLDTGSVVLETQKDWIRLAKRFGVTWMALQRYCYNLDIGTFEKWITKFLKKHECQTTLDKGASK